MAFDEILLNRAADFGSPVLRFYGWTEPAATFGYFQKYAEVEQLTNLRPLMRRPTGGGIVPHDRDWTYSVAVPTGHPWHELRAIESYRNVHEWIRRAFEILGLRSELAPQPLKLTLGQCFQGYEQFDLLYGGVKIAGAAQRRTRYGLLIEGSVQPPDPSMNRAKWHSAMLNVLSRHGARHEPLVWTQELQRETLELAKAKFGSTSFLKKK
jgi:lipoate-protein ligase A